MENITKRRRSAGSDDNVRSPSARAQRLWSPPNEAVEDGDIGIEDAEKAGAGSGDGLAAEIDPDGGGSSGVSFTAGGMIAVVDPGD